MNVKIFDSTYSHAYEYHIVRVHSLKAVGRCHCICSSRRLLDQLMDIRRQEEKNDISILKYMPPPIIVVAVLCVC